MSFTLTFADLVDREQAMVSQGLDAGCGFTCACHGGLTCVRARHPHEPDDTAPHAGYQPGGGPLTQWVCLPVPDDYRVPLPDDPPAPALPVGVPDAAGLAALAEALTPHLAQALLPVLTAALHDHTSNGETRHASAP